MARQYENIEDQLLQAGYSWPVHYGAPVNIPYGQLPGDEERYQQWKQQQGTQLVGPYPQQETSMDPFTLYPSLFGQGGVQGASGLPDYGDPFTPQPSIAAPQPVPGAGGPSPVANDQVQTGTNNGGGKMGEGSSSMERKSNAIVGALRGASQPEKPDVVKPTSPHLPAVQNIRAGQLFDILNSVSNPRMQPPRFSTLGGALGTGRY